MPSLFLRQAIVYLSLLAIAPAARAESPRYLDLEGFSRLLDGNPQSTSLSEEGAIGLSVTCHDRLVDPSLTLGAATLWHDDVVAAKMGEPAQVVAINPAGKQRVLVADLGGRVVTRAAEHQGRLVLAMAPKPTLVLIADGGGQQEVAVPDVGFVWDMLSAPDGSLVVATGEPGRVMAWGPDKKWRTLFAADEAHIKTLAWDAQVGLIAGGGERGVVYRGTLAGNFRALYDSGQTEITALCVDGDAVLVAAATGAQNLAADDEADRRGARPGSKPQAEVRSALVRVALDGSTDVLAGSTDEVVFDIVREKPGSVLIATGAVGRKDARGRLYRLDAVRKVISLLHQSPSRRLTRLFWHPTGLLLTLGQEGTRISEYARVAAGTGIYISPALDTGVNATFGVVQALGHVPKGSRATLSVRTGQTAEPDATWSDWSAEVPAPAGQPQGLPHGRYAQIRLTLTGTATAQPEIIRLRLAYLRQNLPPFIRDISVLDKGLALSALPANFGQDEGRAKVVALGEPSDEAQAAGGGRRPPVRARQTQERNAITVRWLVDDPNGDELTYSLWVRGLQQSTWRLLADEMTDPFFTLQSTQLADGHYVFRVRASDARSNGMGTAREDMRTSRAILIDNTPPTFKNLHVRVQKSHAVLTGAVADAAGLLASLRYSLDGAPLLPLAPADGVLDGPAERIEADLGRVAPGPHSLTVVAVDESQNEAFAQVQFTAPL